MKLHPARTATRSRGTTITNQGQPHLLGHRTVSSKGQIALPKAACQAVGIWPRSRVVITTHPDGSFTIRAATTDDLAALLYRGKRKETAQ
jgi:bifunctional DNA-binding transcriptional regulator/antitoxin component of YhaV-PrlF toxin-antitoxin module